MYRVAPLVKKEEYRFCGPRCGGFIAKSGRGGGGGAYIPGRRCGHRLRRATPRCSLAWRLFDVRADRLQIERCDYFYRLVWIQNKLRVHGVRCSRDGCHLRGERDSLEQWHKPPRPRKEREAQLCLDMCGRLHERSTEATRNKMKGIDGDYYTTGKGGREHWRWEEQRSQQRTGPVDPYIELVTLMQTPNTKAVVT